ncbi:diguanylate cyclase/phosphodiesterase (GGDEF & EAL domains) with PAS/PAC sensor(s) [hydrothermal vent metagenome]|uniref:Diguanylate cyclase/phosphodiesterase (GGDEF & EAL domains) with PAS/PAC sensor(S) n=1 Tax=hydrothermal vent metagenome TaxID=652676 RepID=A0A3B1BH63_9ZZZZ
MKNNLLRVLIVEDSEDDTLLLLRQLKKGGYETQHLQVDNKQRLKKSLLQTDWDIIITDHNMPGFDSSAALAVIKKLDLDIPVIIVSGSIGEDLAVEAMKAGAHDYIMKDNLTRLVPAIERELREVAVRHSQRAAEAAIEYLAFHDSLTGLVNRSEFERRLERAISQVQKGKMVNALLYLDLDQFKVVNDTCGHSAGDELLKQLSALLHARIRGRDTLARLGGDEFCVLMENCSLKQAIIIAGDLHQLVNDFRFVWNDEFFNIGVSIGVVAINKTGMTANDILSAADLACYAAKDEGRNCVRVYKNEDVSMRKRRKEMDWANRIDSALKNNHFLLYQQLIISLNSTNSSHCEYLLRLKDKKRIVYPGTFIPAAERYQRMSLIDRWVLDTSFSYLSRFKNNSRDKNSIISINLSRQSLNEDSLFDFVQTLFSKYELPAKSICFEITETAAIANFRTAINFINRVKELGCLIALDDFGCGLSSFSYLKSLDIDFLKIDGSFIRNMEKNPIDRVIVEAITNIAHIAGFKTIAEYVETQKTIDILKDIGIDYAQGYAIQKPQPLSEEIHRPIQKISSG